jgi:hypothetical protein
MTDARTLAKIRQAAWNAVHKDYKDDPECCFALGFDAGYDAVAQKVEPPVKESGGGFESLPASPKKEWVGLTDEEARELCVANVPYVVDMVRALEAKLKEKNA